MQWDAIAKDFFFSFLFAAPFLWIRRYALRTLFCTAAPVVAYWWFLWLLSDHEIFRINRQAFSAAAGGFCAAHLRLLWSFAQQQFSANKALERDSGSK